MDVSSTGSMTPRRGPLRRLLHRFRQTEAGQSLVEFSMILPLFLVLLFGMVDFGRAFFTWLVVTNAAREGARVAAVRGDYTAVQNRVYASFCDNYPSSCSLDPTLLEFTPDNLGGSRGDATSVTLVYNFEFVTPLGGILQLIGGDALSSPTITAHSSMRLE